MSNIVPVQNTAYPSAVTDTPSPSVAANQGSGFSYAMGQVSSSTFALSPSVAQSLMYRSMTTGVPTAEMDQYGGYSAVKAMFDANGGSYSLDAIPAAMRQQFGQQIATNGVGNLSLLKSEHIALLPSALAEMAKNGIDVAAVNQAQAAAGQGFTTVSGTETTTLTPSMAQSLMQRSMTTGVPKSEMDLYGGYDAVKAMYDSNHGSYSTEVIAAPQRQQLAAQVAATGTGNMTLVKDEHIPISAAVLQTMKSNGIDLGTLTQLQSSGIQMPFVDSSSYIDSFIGAQKPTN